MKVSTIILLLIFLLAVCVRGAEIKDGDIIFQRSTSQQSDAIAAATHSEYTHMGVIFHVAGAPFVYEAVQPVRKTPLKEWIDRGVGGRFVIKRLKDPKGVDFAKLEKSARQHFGKDYDMAFDWSDQRIYCSELVWKAYKEAAGIEIGVLRKLGDFDLSPKVVRSVLAQRYGKDVPLKMQMIAPSDMFASPLLVKVSER